MSVADELAQVESLYSANLREKGVSAAAVGWNSAESQRLRFHKLTSVIAQRDGPVTINDYGCGYGAHLEYLTQQAGIDVRAYNGYDLSEPMLAAARTHLAAFDGTLNLINSSELSTVADYSFVSGTFNVRFASDDDRWADFIRATLARLDACSTKGFAFNLLSTYVDWQEPHLFYADPLYWFDYCKRNFARAVSLLHDYPLYEWTLIVRKDRA